MAAMEPIIAEQLARSPGQVLTPFQRSFIVSTFEKYDSYAATAKICGENYSSDLVRKYIQKVKLSGSPGVADRSGRPALVNAHTERRICRESRRNRRQTLGDISVNILPDACTKTIQRTLKKNGIRKFRTIKKPLLTPSRMAKRLIWAKLYRHWTWNEWQRVMWSDECLIYRSRDSNVGWVFRTGAERHDQCAFEGETIQGGMKLMVWAVIAGNKASALHIHEGNVNQFTYLECLEEYLPEFWSDLYLQHNTYDIPFMHDNSSVHTARIIKSWLEDCEFIVMEWPPYSPDMNPIEHVWTWLKRALFRRHPDLKNMLAETQEDRDYFKQCIQDTWATLPPQYVENLTRSMTKRSQALRVAKGGYTKY